MIGGRGGVRGVGGGELGVLERVLDYFFYFECCCVCGGESGGGR